MIPVFRRNDSFIMTLHPAAQLAFAFSLMALSLMTGNPFCQVAVIAAAGILALSAGVFRQWASWWKLCLFICVAAVIINPLVSRYGSTVIWRGPTVPVFGRLFVTTEALLYGVGMGLRLAAVILVFALITLTVDPDDLLGLMKGRGASSALVSALTMRIVPALMSDANELLDAQKARGVVRDDAGTWVALKSRLPLVKRVLATSLDRGISLAEAMEARGYGSGRRTRYNQHAMRGGDFMVIGLAVLALAAGITAAAVGISSFGYYPTISMTHTAWTVAAIAVPVLFAAGLLVLSRMWKRSNWLRLRV